MTTPIADDFIGQRQRRIEKVEELKKLGIDPYPAHSVKEYSNKEITEQFSNFENKVITLSGRLVSWRDHGKLIFANLQDQSGKIQLWLKNDELQGDLKKGFLPWENLNLVDVGDFIEAHGNVTKTVRGEITLLVKNIRMLTKLNTLPRDSRDTLFLLLVFCFAVLWLFGDLLAPLLVATPATRCSRTCRRTTP